MYILLLNFSCIFRCLTPIYRYYIILDITLNNITKLQYHCYMFVGWLGSSLKIFFNI